MELCRPCKGVNKDGKPCRATVRSGGDFCLFHAPNLDLAAKRAEGRRSGGKSRSRKAVVLSADTPDLPLRSVADVIDLLGQTINQVRTGQLDARIGNCLGVLAGTLLRAIEGGELEKRMEEVEERLAKQPATIGKAW
jgi:hypothetical protein